MIEIKTEQEFVSIVESDDGRYIFVDFYASWCGPCKKISPHIEKFSRIYKNIRFVKVNIDQVDDLAEMYEIDSIPSFKIFEPGNLKPIDELTGANIDKILNLITKYA